MLPVTLLIYGVLCVDEWCMACSKVWIELHIRTTSSKLKFLKLIPFQAFILKQDLEILHEHVYMYV